MELGQYSSQEHEEHCPGTQKPSTLSSLQNQYFLFSKTYFLHSNKLHNYNQTCLNKKTLTNTMKITQKVLNFKTDNLKQPIRTLNFESKFTL